MSVKILNSKILEFQTFRIWKLTNVKKIDKIVFFFPNFEILKIAELVQFRKLANFQILKICKTMQLPKTLNFVDYHVCILSFSRIKKKHKNKYKQRKFE